VHAFDLLPSLPLSRACRAHWPTPRQAFFMWISRKGILWCCLQLPSVWVTFLKVTCLYGLHVEHTVVSTQVLRWTKENS